jgi:hypothetical protein
MWSIRAVKRRRLFLLVVLLFLLIGPLGLRGSWLLRSLDVGCTGLLVPLDPSALATTEL